MPYQYGTDRVSESGRTVKDAPVLASYPSSPAVTLQEAAARLLAAYTWCLHGLRGRCETAMAEEGARQLAVAALRWLVDSGGSSIPPRSFEAEGGGR